MSDLEYPRGSEWRKWDLHIHTPASFHWSGKKFHPDPSSPENVALVDEMIRSLNNAEPAVFAIMDYWTFDGWFALKRRLSEPGAPELRKMVFPGIELRLMAPMKGRLNAHVLFSDQISEQELLDFKSNLKIEFPGQEARNLSNAALVEFARCVPQEKLKHHSLDRSKVADDERYALLAGSSMAELSCDSYKQAIAKVMNNKAIGFMPFDTSDGLTSMERNAHYAYVLGLFKSSPIFETRNVGLWEAFSGIKTVRNSSWFSDFESALNCIPRLAVSGSDAHCFVGKPNDNNRRGYGDFPSEKATWIKANPTFEGLQQAIKEPAKRSYIGKIPPKRNLFNNNKSLFIDALKVEKTDSSVLNGKWLDGTELDLNQDLIAIIGNKGSGKSALADVTALLGNSKQSHHFSFLRKGRFRGKTGEPAKCYTAQARWADGEVLEKNLNENPAEESVEFVKYIPQGHFEDLCNAHVSGKSDVFEKELRSVIFSHADESIRLGALNFDQLIEQQENSLRTRLDGLRGELHKINRQVESLEKQMLPETRKSIEELLVQKKRIVDEHRKLAPENVVKPTEELSGEQRAASIQLGEIANKLKDIKAKKAANHSELTNLAAKKKSGRNILEGIDVVNRAFQHFVTEYDGDAKLLGLDIHEVVKIQIASELLVEAESAASGRETELREQIRGLDAEEASLAEKCELLKAKLNEPQQAYQRYLGLLKDWEEKRVSMLGNDTQPDSLHGLEHRKAQLDKLPGQRASLQAERLKITSQIFDLLDGQRVNREALFQPVQQLIQSNDLIRDEYKLQFKAELSSTTELISDKLFSLVKQTSGEFRGDSESRSVIRDLLDKNDVNEKHFLLTFVGELHKKLEFSSNGPAGIESILRKGCTPNEVYDFLFGLEYLIPRYTLMFQGAQIGQLSPGQRGALLLIFYLLVDKGSAPIILDQPEENLDNETIVRLLVPVLNEAKQKRQIIMVTHNPNLAVVCDAEQIIHCEFDRKDDNCISYTAGAIECKAINRKVVDVLEGTMPAFDNRKIKYHQSNQKS